MYAKSVLPESSVFVNGDKTKKIPITFSIYLVEIGKRKILIDAGCDTMPNFVMEKFYSPAFVLRQIGFSAEDITDVIITHAHHDHIEAVKYFCNAVIYISKTEFEKGKRYIPDNFKVSIFENEFSLSPKIKIIELGGHSHGSAIVEIKAGDTIHVLAGDECYTNANIENRICTGAYFNKKKSMEFIEKYSDKKYRVYTCHDISLKTERII